MSKSIGLVKPAGTWGRMLTLLGQHPEFECVFACSSSQAGDLVQRRARHGEGLVFENLTPDEAAARKVDALVLCLPDVTRKWCPTFEGTDTVILDVSSDHPCQRLDLRPHRTLPRGHPAQHTHQQPGLLRHRRAALRPVVDDLAGPARLWRLDYSVRPNLRRERSQALADGVTPYKLVHHTHEREMSRHLGTPVLRSTRGSVLPRHFHRASQVAARNKRSRTAGTSPRSLRQRPFGARHRRDAPRPDHGGPRWRDRRLP